MAPKKGNCGCGCDILPKQTKEKPAKEKKDVKKSY
jgi:hypothetical protein